jgi:uncharacterized cupredoxin-like copper-binding protein|tara:strand:- start:961 stop:1395 length:435 start_codon:yes stop_codon:yes gene_type:complete
LAIFAILFLSLISYLLFNYSSNNDQNIVEVNLFGGEFDGKYGFGLSNDSLSSPGPTIYLNTDQKVVLKFTNTGDIPHTFRVINNLNSTEQVLFGAFIGESLNPINPNNHSKVNFVIDEVGSFFYICNIPGHLDLGMFGELIIKN